jgi:hypothetical protein
MKGKGRRRAGRKRDESRSGRKMGGLCGKEIKKSLDVKEIKDGPKRKGMMDCEEGSQHG